MIRRAFRMSVHPGRSAEYERRHDAIWDELRDALFAHGVDRYSIFHDPETDDLFAYVEFESEEAWRRLATTDVCRRWWHFMQDVMPSHPDHAPVARDLHEVFHIARANELPGAP